MAVIVWCLSTLLFLLYLFKLEKSKRISKHSSFKAIILFKGEWQSEALYPNLQKKKS